MVDESEIKETAKSAMLKIEENRVDNLKRDFEDVLEMFKKLDKVDIEDTEPSFHPIEIEDKSRSDNVKESLSPDEVFQNSENNQNSKFKGPSV